MITVTEMMEATLLPEIQSINFDAFSKRDLVNLILQRSEIIHDQPRSGRVIRAWANGNEAPAMSLAEDYGAELARRAAAIIYLEYLQIRQVITTRVPRTAADIGCGYAIFDLFLWRDLKCKLHLIDLEASTERNFGFADKGAAYTSLSVAKKFLIENEVDADDITCHNPAHDDLSDISETDLAFSFLSCGFHYPVQTYTDFFQNTLSDTGAVILDLRTAKADQGIKELNKIGPVELLVKAAKGNAQRMIVTKQ